MKKMADKYNPNTYNNQSLSLISLRILALLTLFALLFLPLASAAENDTEQALVSKAYSCLQNKTSGNCDDLSTEEKIFTVLAINQCRAELNSDSLNSGECWPSENCKVKTTAQAMLALKSASSATQDWLYSKNAAPTELVWYLEIESDEPTSCTISYGGSSYTINIDENKKVDTNAGSCLFPAQDDYWLQISRSCYNTEFAVSCDQSFLTTTLFRKSISSTIYVSEETSSASAEGSTKETADNYCFADSGLCTYEGTLWAALALDAVGKDISAYLPYLITLADENQRYLPDSFLYTLTAGSDHKVALLGKQKSNQWWMESGDKYYDTALALYSLQKESPVPQQKTNAKTWLLDSQGSNGCWENNIRNTGFILASVWPKTFAGGTGGLSDCEASGKYCASSGTVCTASTGQVLAEYDCPGTVQKCCSVQPTVKTCSELGGEICSSNQRCVGGTTVSASDLRSTEKCCAGSGDCSSATAEETECETNNGVCRTGSCSSSEEEASYSCDTLSQTCCVQESGRPFETPGDGGGGSTLWVWILLILIVLVAIGIIFRNKLRMLWFRMKSGGGKLGPSTSHMPPPHFPPYIQRPIQRIERRILVPQHTPAQRPTPITRMKSGAQKELDDVLRKLKEMGK